eukprot:11648416-Alexandrium_andersonii.AAC.1
MSLLSSPGGLPVLYPGVGCRRLWAPPWLAEALRKLCGGSAGGSPGGSPDALRRLSGSSAKA